LAGLRKPVGLNLRWDTALRDFQTQLEPRVSRRRPHLITRPREDGSGSMRDWST